jgi:hypothetical protein
MYNNIRLFNFTFRIIVNPVYSGTCIMRNPAFSRKFMLSREYGVKAELILLNFINGNCFFFSKGKLKHTFEGK